MPMNRRPRTDRVHFVDAARGVAIVAMVVFHIAWDLYYFGFSTIDVTSVTGWVVFQKSIVTAFLFLVGVSLVLAHGAAIRWSSFWFRFTLVFGAALLTTVGTYIALPEYFVYFGILHAIAAFSLIGLPFVRLPGAVAVAAAAVFLVSPVYIPSHPAMIARELSWIGFWPLPPPTTDIVPFFPWFGVVLLGIATATLLVRSPLWPRIGGIRLDGIAGRTLRFMGRWSLLIYLVHQPLLFGAMNLVPRPPAQDSIAFTQSCEQSCGINGHDAPFCARYCLCALEQVETQNLWSVVEAETRTPEEDLVLSQLTTLCEAMARE